MALELSKNNDKEKTHKNTEGQTKEIKNTPHDVCVFFFFQAHVPKTVLRN